jgi:hypothetical protein
MSLIKFSDYLDEALSVPVIEMLADDEIIVEWSEKDWFKFTVAERAELEAQAIGGWSAWQIDPIDAPLIAEDEKIWEYLHTLDEEACDICGEDPCICNKDESTIGAEEWLKEYQAKNTMQRRQTMRNKDRQKFSNRQQKRLASIERKKGGNKVKRIKGRKKWMRVNKAKIANAQRVYGGKAHSKFTKKK